MQKKLLTMAVAGALAAPVAALAQVTVYGTIDTGIRNISKVVTATGDDSVLQVTQGTRTTNRWGLRGSEDLGGGLMANFTLEGNYTSDADGDDLDGFNRKSVIGLSKGGNSVDVGRDYTVNFKAQGIYDPMSYTYTGITPASTVNTAGTRSNNLVTAGFRFGTGGVRVDYAPGEVVGQNSWNSRMGVMGDFAFGPTTVAAAFSTMDDETGTFDTTTMNVGAAYVMGPFTFRGGFSTEESDIPGAKEETTMFMAGVQYAFSPTMNGRFGFYSVSDEVGGADAGEGKLFIAALDYYLSKRTTVYVVVDRADLDEAAKAGLPAGARTDGSMGIGAGIAHSF